MLTEGALMMKHTLVGIVEVDPKKMLHDGIKRQLVLQISKLLHDKLTFNPKAKVFDLYICLFFICKRGVLIRDQL